MSPLCSFAPLLLVSTLLGGCHDTFGALELEPSLGVATVPFLVLYERPMEKWCDTDNKVNFEGCRQSSEVLTILSVTCDAPGCVVEPAGYAGALRVTAAQPGRPVLRVEARGESSDEVVTNEVALEVLDPAEVDVQVGLAVSSRTETPYDALCEEGSAYVSLTVSERGTGREIRIPEGHDRWNVTGGALIEGYSDERIVRAAPGASDLLVEAVLSDSVTASARLDVVAAADAVRSLVASGESDAEPFSGEPTELTISYGTETLLVALEDAKGRRYPGGADRVRVEGEGCALETEIYGSHLNAAEGVRWLTTPSEGSCSLVVRDGASERRIPVRSEDSAAR